MADAPIAPAVEDKTADVPHAAGKQDINPWSVSGEVGEDGKVKAIDYRKLIDEFGTSLIDDALLERWEKVTGSKPHRFMRRGIVFSHRDLTAILDRYEKVRGKATTGEDEVVLFLTRFDRMSRSIFTLDEGPAATACTLDTPRCLTLSSTRLLEDVDLGKCSNVLPQVAPGCA
jgi:hypothetical protein